jgi:hypothetical protein
MKNQIPNLKATQQFFPAHELSYDHLSFNLKQCFEYFEYRRLMYLIIVN